MQEADIPPFIVHGQNSTTNSHRTVLRISFTVNVKNKTNCPQMLRFVVSLIWGEKVFLGSLVVIDLELAIAFLYKIFFS